MSYLLMILSLALQFVSDSDTLLQFLLMMPILDSTGSEQLWHIATILAC